MDSINEWLNLDQADEDIGVLLTQPTNDYHQPTNNQRFSFQPLHFTLDQQHQQQQQQQQLINNQPIISLDPSTILNYPSSASHSDDSEQSTTATKSTPTQFNIPFDPPADHFSTYALDPALLSASIPSSHHPTNPNSTITSSTTTHHNTSATTTPQTNKIHELKITLPRRSPPSFKKEEQLSPISRTSHSRSSSAITFGQQPTPSSPDPSSHKRTLSHSHPLVNVPEWEDKPSAEEYKMLSSKEKRQLRNKISARNFRHRRKQHISALEQQVAQRDQTIEALYNDLGAAQNENKELKSQVEQLKQKWSDLMKKIEEMSLGSISPTLPNNLTLSTTPAAQSTSALPVSPRLRSAKTNAMISLPNLHKDLGSHTRKPFNGVGGMAGGNVGVHTTLIPDVSVDVYKGPLSSGPRLFERGEREISPQAKLEQKLESDPAKRAMIELGRKLFPSENDELVLEKGQGSRQGRIETEGGLEEELANRLWRMVYQALGHDTNHDNAHQALDLFIDPLKLAACLDGRLVLKLVEPAPPPYPSSPSLVDSQPDPVDLISPRLADCLI